MWLPFLSTLALYLFPDDFDGSIFYEAIARTFVSIWMGDVTKLLAAPEPKAREAAGIISAFPWLQATTITEFSPPGTTFLPSGTSSSPPSVTHSIRPITSGKSDVVVWAAKPINSAPKNVLSGHDLFVFSAVIAVLLGLVCVFCSCGVLRRSKKAALAKALLEKAVEDKKIAQSELISSLGRQTQVTEDLAQKTLLLRAAKDADKAEQARILVLRQRIALDVKVAADQEEAIAARERAIAARDAAIESLRSEMEKTALGFQQVCEERDRLYRENEALTKAAEDLRGELSSLRATVEAERNAPRPEAKVVKAVKEVEEAGSVSEETVKARSEDTVPAAAAAIASVTTSNGWLDAPPPPPEGEDEVKFSSSRRKFRKDLVEAYEKQRTARGSFPQDVVLPLRLPCFDLYYRSLPIPKPLDEEPALESEDDKQAFPKCIHCDKWYTKEDFCNHLPVCNKFFDSAVYCLQYDQVFAANAAFEARHAQECRHEECPALRLLPPDAPEQDGLLRSIHAE